MTAPDRPSPIPDSYRRVTPCLTVRGATRALEFYAAVFGAAERMRFSGPGGTILHAEVQIGDSVVMIEDEDPRRGTRAPPSGGGRVARGRCDAGRDGARSERVSKAEPAEHTEYRQVGESD